MKRRLSRTIDTLPLRHKLTAIIFLASFSVSFIGLAGYVAKNIVQLRDRLQQEAQTIARTVASYSAADLAFHDEAAARATLQGLDQTPQVANSFLYDEKGRLFVAQKSNPAAPPAPTLGASLSEIRDDYLHVIEPVRYKENMYGTLYVYYSLNILEQRVRSAWITFSAIMTAALVMSFLFAIWLQKIVSRPILALAAVANRVSKEGDYTVRARQENNDEIGSLGSAFNAMLDQIHLREQARLSAAQELAKAKAEFEAMFRAIPDAVMFADTQRRILRNNPAVKMLFGYDDSELIGQTTQLLYADSEEFSRQGKSRFHSGPGAEPGPYEMRYKRKDGLVFWTESLGAQVKDEQGQHIGFIGIFRDITERKHAEATMRIKDNAIATAINAFAFADLDGKMTYVNHAFLSMWGYERENEIVGHSALEFWQSKEAVSQIITTLLDSGGWTGELVSLRRDKSTFVALVSASTVYDKDGHPVQLMASFLDITQRKQSEETNRQLNVELEQRVRDRTLELETANKELEAFSYSVSHDLRAPLRSINGFAHALAEDYGSQLDVNARDYLDRVQKASEKMGVLIDDLLNLSRLSRTPLHRDGINLSAIALEVIDDLRKTEPGRSVDVVITPDMTCNGDPNLLRVAMQNLIGNAWKYTRRTEHAHIEFTMTVRDKRSVFCVRDNGAGFNMQYADKLFSPFQRLHSAQDFEGTGVGLATVSRIIKRHSGNIWAESVVGQGATFCFTLGEA